MDGAIEAVEVAVVEDGGGDVVLELLVRPDGVGGVLVGVEEGGSHSPPGGEVELVVDEEGVGGVFAHLGGPGGFPEDFSIGLGDDVHGFVSEDGEGFLIAAPEGDDSCVAAFCGGRIPEELAGVFVEGEPGGVGVEEEFVADDGRAGGKSPGGHGGLGDGGEVGPPAGFAGGFIEAGDEALLADDVEPLPLDGGWGVGAAGIVDGDEFLGVAFGPDGIACIGVEALDEVFALGVANRVGATFADGDAGVAEVDRGLPELFGAGGGPLVGPIDFVIVAAIAVGTPPLGPLRGGREGGTKEEEGEGAHRQNGYYGPWGGFRQGKWDLSGLLPDVGPLGRGIHEF